MKIFIDDLECNSRNYAPSDYEYKPQIALKKLMNNRDKLENIIL